MSKRTYEDWLQTRRKGERDPFYLLDKLACRLGMPDLTPEQLRQIPDEKILRIYGWGPGSLRILREYFCGLDSLTYEI